MDTLEEVHGNGRESVAGLANFLLRYDEELKCMRTGSDTDSGKALVSHFPDQAGQARLGPWQGIGWAERLCPSTGKSTPGNRSYQHLPNYRHLRPYPLSRGDVLRGSDQGDLQDEHPVASP